MGSRAGGLSLSRHAFEQSAPASSEDVFARLPSVSGETALAQAAAEGWVGGHPAKRLCESLRIAARDQQRALLVDEQLARGRSIGGDERRAASKRLEGLVRDHPLGFGRGAEDAEGAPRAAELAGELFVVDPAHPLDVRRSLGEQVLELAAADEAQGQLWGGARCPEDRLHAVQRDQLPDEEARERLARRPAGPEEPLLGADEADLHVGGAEACELGEVVCVRAGIGDDEVGGAERVPVDRRERPRRERVGPEAPTVGDERVSQRDERVEDDRPKWPG